MKNGELAHSDEQEWHTARGWRMPDEVEPVLIVLILFIAMIITRRRHYSIFRQFQGHCDPLLRDMSPPSSPSSEEFSRGLHGHAHPPKVRSLCHCLHIETPNSSRFTKNLHSRILQKYPFLVEMFYWGISFGAYRLTTTLAAWYYGERRSMWDSAQEHGLYLLDIESQWLKVLNRGYALIHIPGTVGFIAYYYAQAPTHARFCTVRRTITLSNFLAFAIFVTVPTMPPRLLPEQYGFVDTVNLEDAESVWMSGNFVNKLAAMPSMHFGYAFCIGGSFVADSGVLRGLCRWTRNKLVGGSDVERLPRGANAGKLLARRSASRRVAMFAFGIWYPCWILLTIVATANHYFFDALAAIFVVMLGYLHNTLLLVFLPAEDVLLWALRLEKPVPSTGRKGNLVLQ